MSLTQHISTKKTKQTEEVFGKNQVENNAGGYTFAVTPWVQLRRFLTLGSEGGSYYVGEAKLTRECAASLLVCLKEDSRRTIDEIVHVSDKALAVKNDWAIFALAVCASGGDATAKQLAFAALPKVCRIGTHLFQFVANVNDLRGWGRGLRRAVSRWYTGKKHGELALQLAKYQQRDGWSHRDVLRLSHPVLSDERNNLVKWAVGKLPDYAGDDAVGHMLKLRGLSVDEAIEFIGSRKIPRECIPTEILGEAKVWRAMLPSMGMTALLRNLGTMSKLGVLAPLADTAKEVCRRLTDEAEVRQSRIHPFNVLVSLRTYQQGCGVKSDARWAVNQQIVAAMDKMFTLAFANIVPSGKRFYLAVDVSGSMSSGIGKLTGIDCRTAAAAMAMATVRSEPQTFIGAFTAKDSTRLHSGIHPLLVSSQDSLASVIQTFSRTDFGRTDCSLSMRHALDEKIPVDVFVVYTDNETYAGDIHPFQALEEYRRKMGIPAKLVVVGMTASKFSIANPDDAGMMDVAGMDASVPSLISQFAMGDI